MPESVLHSFHAGDSLQDLCRQCKSVRAHTVIVVDHEGMALRVICDYCGSQHNYRGGEAREISVRTEVPIGEPDGSPSGTESGRITPMTNANVPDGSNSGLEVLLRRVIREEIGLTPVAIAEKWRGGELILKPGKPGLQEKSWPIDTFFHKIVMLRNRLRVLEQQINGTDVPEDLKVRMQAYITGCYGTLTSFNVLFSEEDDRFHGTAE